MKKTILTMLLALMVATPCLAQEMETDGIFSIENTRWLCFGPLIVFSNQQPFFRIEEKSGELAFDQGIAYECSENKCSSYYYISYLDMPVLGIFLYPFRMIGVWDLYVMQPTTGIGVNTVFGCSCYVEDRTGMRDCSCYFGIGIMLKVENNWTPPPE